VFFLLDMAGELDLSAIYAVYEARDPRGVKAYEPRMMVVLLLYAYCVGIPSSRRIERACYEDLAFRVLTGNQQPDHSRISDFRLVHLDALAGLFVQVLRLCQKSGLVSLGNVALDGTKVKANASKHKAMSHERMLKTEAQLEAEIAALLRKAELIDAQEDARYGKGKRGDELPKELQRRQDRLDALRKAKAELEAEAAADHARRREQHARAAEEQAAEAAVQAAADTESEVAARALAKEAQQAERRARSARRRAELARRLAIDKAQAADLSTPDPLISVDPLAMPSRNLPTTAAGDPKGNAQRNFTDPDSHILKGGDGWIQGYNCQAAVDGDHQIIVAVGVSNQASDQHHFVPMLERIVANTGQPAAREHDRRRGLLQHKQHRGERAARVGCLPLHQPPGTRQAAQAITGSSSKRSGCTGPDGPQTPIQSRPGDLRPALAEGFSEGVDHRRAGVWSDQRGTGPGSLPAARAGEGRQ
jgi:transposase